MKNTQTGNCLPLREVMFPHHINGSGRIFGGVILSNIDVSGQVACQKVCTHRFLPVFFNAVEFKKPVLIDDILTCWAEVTYIGTTSVSTHIRVEVERKGEVIQVTEGDAIYVALDDNDKPLPVRDALTPDGKRFLRKQQKAEAQGTERKRLAGMVTAPLGSRRGCPSISAVMFPHDLNGSGRIFGGVILSHIDMAGVVACKKLCTHRIVTVLFKSVEFKKPVLFNDILTCWAKVTRIGKSSMTTHIWVEVERDGTRIPVTEAEVIYVAVDNSDKSLVVESALTPAGGAFLRKQRQTEAEAAKKKGDAQTPATNGERADGNTADGAARQVPAPGAPAERPSTEATTAGKRSRRRKPSCGC